MVSRLSGVLAVIAALLVWDVSSAQAQSNASVSYDVTFEEVANNCAANGLSLNGGKVRLAEKGGSKISVDIAGAPTMSGARGRGGKFKAEARGPTARAGVSGRFSVAGRASEAEIQLLFIVEFYRGKKPLCTQSWSAEGKRSK